MRNNLSRSGNEGTRKLKRFDRDSCKWQTLEWQTLIELWKEDRARFPVLNRLSRDHLVRILPRATERLPSNADACSSSCAMCVCVCAVSYTTQHDAWLPGEGYSLLRGRRRAEGEGRALRRKVQLLRVTGSLLALSSSRHWLSSGFVTGSQRLSCGDSAMAIALVGFTYDFTLGLATYDSRTRIEPRAVFDARTWCTSAHSLACVVRLANGTP